MLFCILYLSYWGFHNIEHRNSGWIRRVLDLLVNYIINVQITLAQTSIKNDMKEIV